MCSSFQIYGRSFVIQLKPHCLASERSHKIELSGDELFGGLENRGNVTFLLSLLLFCLTLFSSFSDL